MHGFAEWLSGTAPSVAIQSTLWLIRVLQGTHLLTAGVVTGTGVLLSLRVLGWHRPDQPFHAVWSRFAPWLGVSLAIMLTTGLAQTIGDPVRALTATSYWVKMAALLCAVAGTLALARAGRDTPRARRFPLVARIIAAAIILMWLALPLLGRMIAYDRAIWGSLSLRR